MNKFDEIYNKINLALSETHNRLEEDKKLLQEYRVLLVLTGDVGRNEISKYISPRDLYHLSLINKHAGAMLGVNISNNDIIYNNSGILEIERRLYKIFGDNADNFIQALEDSQAVISGGFYSTMSIGRRMDR